MKALVLRKPGQADLEIIADPVLTDTNVLLKVRYVGFCGSDLNSYRGLNPLVTYPRILGHEVSATVVEDLGREGALSAGTNVSVSPYTNCGECSSCLRGRPNACQLNQTLGVQRDGALTEFIVMPREKLYPARLTLKELCLVEPLTVGFHAVSPWSCTRTTRLRFGVVAESVLVWSWRRRVAGVRVRSVSMWTTKNSILRGWQAANLPSIALENHS